MLQFSNETADSTCIVQLDGTAQLFQIRTSDMQKNIRTSDLHHGRKSRVLDSGKCRLLEPLTLAHLINDLSLAGEILHAVETW